MFMIHFLLLLFLPQYLQEEQYVVQMVEDENPPRCFCTVSRTGTKKATSKLPSCGNTSAAAESLLFPMCGAITSLPKWKHRETKPRKAPEEAVGGLKETTKSIFRENVYIIEALRNHVDKEKELRRAADMLGEQAGRLQEEKEMNDRILRDKIVQVQLQTDML
eukprot:Nk52_evm1s588 gene=Nk52_evmTU1s588